MVQRKGYYLLFIVILLGGIIFNCEKSSKDKLKGQKVELKFSVWGTPVQLKTEYEVIKHFERKYRNIKIKLLHIPIRRYDERILAMAASGNAPDVMMIEITPFPFYAAKGILMDLDPYIKRDKIDISDIYPLALKAFSYKGKQYGFPRDISGLVMYYNTDLFDKVGINYPNKNWTWRDFEKACKALTKDFNGDGIIDSYGAVCPPVFMLLWGFGGDIFDNPFNPTKCIIDYKNSIIGLKFFENLFRKKIVATVDVIQEEGDYQLFMTGKVGMFFQGRWFAPIFKDIKTFKWKIAPVPKSINGKRWTLHGGTCYGVYSKTKHPEEAWTFLKFYTSKEGVRIAIKGGRTTPVYKSIANSKEFLSMTPPENMKIIVDTMNYGRRAYYLTKNREVDEIIVRNLDLLMLGKITAVQYAKRVKKEINKKILNK